MIEKYKGQKYQRDKKTFAMVFIFIVMFFLIFLCVYNIYKSDKELSKKDFLISQLKQDNQNMKDRLLLQEYFDMEDEKCYDRYIEQQKQKLDDFNLTKYKTVDGFDFIYPVENPGNCYVAMSESEYGYRILREYGRNFHHGIDIKMVFDSEIICPMDGVVYDTGFNEYAGNFIEIVHEIAGREYMTVYFHLSEIKVIKDDKVKQGEIISIVGDTGKLGKGQVHLHYAIYKKTKQGWKSFNLFSNSLHGAYENKEMNIYNFLVE